MVKKSNYPYDYGNKIENTNWKALFFISFLSVGFYSSKLLNQNLTFFCAGLVDELRTKFSQSYFRFYNDILIISKLLLKP